MFLPTLHHRHHRPRDPAAFEMLDMELDSINVNNTIMPSSSSSSSTTPANSPTILTDDDYIGFLTSGQMTTEELECRLSNSPSRIPNIKHQASVAARGSTSQVKKGRSFAAVEEELDEMMDCNNGNNSNNNGDYESPTKRRKII